MEWYYEVLWPAGVDGESRGESRWYRSVYFATWTEARSQVQAFVNMHPRVKSRVGCIDSAGVTDASC